MKLQRSEARFLLKFCAVNQSLFCAGAVSPTFATGKITMPLTDQASCSRLKPGGRKQAAATAQPRRLHDRDIKSTRMACRR